MNNDTDNSMDWLFEHDTLETNETITQRVLTRQAKREMIKGTQKEKLTELIKKLPPPGWSYHVISNGQYDFWTFIPALAALIGRQGLFLHMSTWTMSRNNAVDMIERFDSGQFKEMTLFTGLYFKRRESAVYAKVVEAFIERKQRYLAFKNHAKIILIGDEKEKYIIEGSANFTANPRMEQYVLTRDDKLFDFHKEWMEEILAK